MPTKETWRTWALAVGGLLLAQAVTLLVMGRLPICACGYVKAWHGVVRSAENSQHLSDWYTFSHLIHGFIFYWLLSRLARRPVGARLALAVAIEAVWSWSRTAHPSSTATAPPPSRSTITETPW